MPTLGKVLLADDSPHAQRMGERILRDEGYDVVTVTDGETAIMRIKDVDPDVVIVDAFLPQVSGYDLCGYIKKQQQYSHVRVILTSTALEKVDEDQAYRAGADGQLKKPFEASVMLKSLKDLIGGSEKDKKKRAGTTLDLNAPIDEAAATETELSRDSEPEERSVSALQAWLQANEPEPEEPQEAAMAASEGAGAGALAAMAARGEINNPHLLRKPEEEEEDLTLRNNPVARLRQMSPSESSPARIPSVVSREKEESSTSGSVRSFRVPSPAFRDDEDEPAQESRPAVAPKRSLLDALAEFERATELEQEPQATEEKDSAQPASAMESSVVEVPEEQPAEVEAPNAAAEPDQVLADAVEDVAEPMAVVESDKEINEPGESDSSAVALELPEEPVYAGAALQQSARAAVMSLGEADVRLDEEEIRAAVEIAVSASMPAIVDEVTRCVLLALEARVQQSRELETVQEPR